MDRIDVYDALDDLRDELSGMAYEVFAMAMDEETGLGSDPAPLDRGKVASLASLSSRLTDAASKVYEVNKTLAMSDKPLRSFAGLTIIEDLADD